MENLVTTETSLAIRGSSGKLGSLIKQSLERASLSTISINRETNLSLLKDSMIILDFTGPNPKNERYWETFSLDKVLVEQVKFLEWVKITQSVYVRMGSYGEFNRDLSKYETVAKEISRAVNAYLSDSDVHGCIIYAANIYGRKSLRNFVDVAIESNFRQEILTLMNKDQLLNTIYFEDLVNFLLDLVERLQSGHVVSSNFALISESLYSVSTINEYIANQVANFSIRRELQQELVKESSLIDSNSAGVKLKFQPHTLKSYIDSEVKNGLGCDSHVLKT
jgi:dTDP-4-dehydrorhamnose reductase